MIMENNSKVVNNIEVKIEDKEIAELIGDVCSSTYGVVGLTKVKSLKSQLAIILNRNNYLEGILLTKEKNKYVVDVHVVMAYGVKISEVVRELYKGISYNLNKKYGPIFNKINIYVEELRDL